MVGGLVSKNLPTNMIARFTHAAVTPNARAYSFERMGTFPSWISIQAITFVTAQTKFLYSVPNGFGFLFIKEMFGQLADLVVLRVLES